MTLQEAIKSGKRIRRQKYIRFDWLTVTHDKLVNRSYGFFEPFKMEDILADDWEVEEEKRELKWIQIEAILEKLLSFDARANARFKKSFKKELGFKE